MAAKLAGGMMTRLRRHLVRPSGWAGEALRQGVSAFGNELRISRLTAVWHPLAPAVGSEAASGSEGEEEEASEDEASDYEPSE